jgi:conjugative transposon protein traI
MNRLILLVESRIRGDVYVRFGGELPKTHRSNTAGRWMLSLPLKSVHNLVKDARKVQKSILLIGEISDIYVNSFQKMLSDENYTPDELSAIAYGYTQLLQESSDVLEEMKSVVNINGLSMSDKERMDVIDRAYNAIRNYRDLVSYYTRKNISVSYLRAKKKKDTDRVMALYGSADERYW